ncbi:DUF1924 domain-containing protein [Nitrogeniibacter mangrovi]|nr:DUF1924 domain-containing protein [Nitrogeniibacter mangrovi]
MGLGLAAQADEAASLRDAYAARAGVSAATLIPEGEQLFRAGGTGERHCTACHTDDPTQDGKTRVGKRIAPMAPAANPARFTDPAKVEKWFGRNCKDVLARACSDREKAAVIAWLMSLETRK